MARLSPNLQGKDLTMNALTLLKQDHENVKALFNQISTTDDPAQKRQLVEHVIEQLSVHAAIEEQLFYPAVRRCSEDITDAVLEGLEEHHIAKWTLAELERMGPDDERFDAKVKVLSELILHHAEEEEQELFPLVRDALSVQQLEELGDTMLEAKKGAPTRPHPRLPDTPPFNLLIGAPFAIADRVINLGKDAVERVLTRK